MNFGDVLGIIAVIFLLAFLVEALVEYAFGTLFDKIQVLQPYKWTVMYIALVVGVIGAFVYRFDFLHLVGAFVGTAVDITTFGIFLTGLAIGRGSNFVHDLFDKFFKPVQVDKP